MLTTNATEHSAKHLSLHANFWVNLCICVQRLPGFLCSVKLWFVWVFQHITYSYRGFSAKTYMHVLFLGLLLIMHAFVFVQHSWACTPWKTPIEIIIVVISSNHPLKLICLSNLFLFGWRLSPDLLDDSFLTLVCHLGVYKLCWTMLPHQNISLPTNCLINNNKAKSHAVNSFLPNTKLHSQADMY